MWKKWLPWRFFIRALARKKGFLDPIAFFSKLQSFGQPSEVTMPIEIVRLATILIARGSLNVVAIQHNLDWNWPYWVVRQFDPKDVSFIPRAFSLTHINLTHRNWTAVGIPDLSLYPIVDPRGLLTPFLDGWSLDAWVVQGEGDQNLIPAYLKTTTQKWHLEKTPSITTHSNHHHLKLNSHISVEKSKEGPYCMMTVEASSASAAWLVISLRPLNPEGVSEIRNITLLDQGLTWQVNKKERIYFNEVPDKHYFSEFREGDVYRKVMAANKHPEKLSAQNAESVECSSGMATAAAMFRIPEHGQRKIEIQIPLTISLIRKPVPQSFIVASSGEAEQIWSEALRGHTKLQVADKQTQAVYDAAVYAMILHTPGIDAFPGPYTYKHFWFRDAAFIVNALLGANLIARAEKILDHFPARQRLTGYFCSQDGEWDSNGQVLWIYRRFCELTGTLPKAAWKDSIKRGAEWMKRKRLPEDLEQPHAGLFPPGFSAEHLGPNDYYYWDDFWGVEGFFSAAYLMQGYQDSQSAQQYENEAGHFETCLLRSLDQSEARLKTKAMPASPYRRLDTGAIGSLAIGYPLTFWEPDDLRVMQTVEYLLKNHFIEHGFFHDMSHSGINPYLTLTVAQTLLRNYDPRYADIMRRIQKLASPTGQWPEAVHPQTLGGCMGDGQHIWAAAEWILMIKNCFVREEKERLILCSGVLPEWYEGGKKASFGVTPISQGLISVELFSEGTGVRVSWKAEWRGAVPTIEVRLPGYTMINVNSGETTVLLAKEKHS